MADTTLSPDEEEAIAIAKAKAAAAANKGSGQNSSQDAGQQPQSSWWDYPHEALRAFNSGLFSIPDMPFVVGGKINNVVRSVLAMQPDTSELAPGVEQSPKAPPPEPKPVIAPFSQTWERFNPTPRDAQGKPLYPWTDTIAGAAAPAVVEALTGAPTMASVPGRLLIRAPITTASTVAGKEAGGYVGEQVGGEKGRQAGEEAGAIVGGGLPGIVREGFTSLVRAPLVDQYAKQRLQDFETAGVPPSMGGVGGKQSGLYEDATVGVPFAGGPAYRARSDQYAAVDQSLRDVASALRGGQGGPSGAYEPPSGPITSKVDVGNQAAATAETGAGRAQTEAHQTYDPLMQQMGRDTTIDPGQQIDELTALEQSKTPGVRRPVVTSAKGLLDESRYDPLNPPRIVSQPLEDFLQQAKATQQANLDSAKPGSSQAASAQSMLDEIARLRDRNRGLTVQNQVDLRGMTGRDYARANIPVRESDLMDIHTVQSNQLRRAALDAGIPPETFDAINARYGTLKQQQGVMEDVADAKNPYNAMFGQAGETDRLTALKEHAPNELARLLADNLELRTRGAQAGHEGTNPRTIDRNDIPTWWNSQSEQAKTAYAGPVGTWARDKMDATVRVMEYDQGRPTRTIPTGGSSIGAPATLFQNPAIVSGISALLGAGGHPYLAAAGAFPSVTTYALGKLMTNPALTRQLVNRPAGNFIGTDLGRLLASVVAGQQ